MALTYSNMMPLGTKAPKFSLSDTVTNKTNTLDDIRGENATLVCFICNHCPYVKHLASEFEKFNALLPKGVGVVAISSNDIETYPQDAPPEMTRFAEENKFGFPYLFDEDQSVAKAYGAECTPDFFLFDADLSCVYRGRYDESSPGNKIPVTGHDLFSAIDSCLKGFPVSDVQYPSMGCNIKWRA